MTENCICDTTILIDFCFGSKKTQSIIENTTKNLTKYFTYIIFGEFVRTIYDTIRKLLNHFLKNEDMINEYDDFSDFVLDVNKDLYLFSGQKANQITKLVPFLIDEIKSKIIVYKSRDLPLRIAIKNIINDLNSYKRRLVLKNFIPLKTSYRCLNLQRKLHIYSNEDFVDFDTPQCPECKNKVHNYFKKRYSNEMKRIYNNFESLTKKGFMADEKKKLKESFEFIMQYKNGDIINGRKHYCWNLTDIYIVLEAPNDFIILTTNLRHQKPVADCIKKKCYGLV